MHAITQRQFGPGDVLRLAEVPLPQPRATELRIAVQVASVNAGDWRVFIGKPYIIRIAGYGLLRPANLIPGQDIAGIVDAVGSQVTGLAPGQAVFGQVHSGGFAEYVCCRPDQITRIPESAGFEAASAIPSSGFAALQGLRDAGQLRPGQRVLINGAAGGVGTFAVQIAKALGGQVTGVCSTGNLELVRSLGAEFVVDYSKDDFTAKGPQYDLIFDLVGNRSLAEYQRALVQSGTYVACTAPPGDWLEPVLFYMQLANESKKSGRRLLSLLSKPNQPDLEYLAGLLSDGRLRPVIERRYTLPEVPAAIAHQGTGHARGKSVIQIGPSSSQGSPERG